MSPTRRKHVVRRILFYVMVMLPLLPTAAQAAGQLQGPLRRVQGGGGAYPPPVQPPVGSGLQLFAQRNYSGDRRVLTNQVADLRTLGFDNRTQSLRVASGEVWEVCTEPNFRGCRLASTDWNDLGSYVGNLRISSARPRTDLSGGGSGGGGGWNPPPSGGGRLEMWDQTNYRGDRREITNSVADLRTLGFNDRAQSLRIQGRERQRGPVGPVEVRQPWVASACNLTPRAPITLRIVAVGRPVAKAARRRRDARRAYLAGMAAMSSVRGPASSSNTRCRYQSIR